LKRFARFVAARKRLFGAVLVGLVAYPALPAALTPTTRFICSWDIGAACYIAATAWLFATALQSQMAANARAQEEGEWTIFWVTMGAVVVSFVVVLGEFASTKDLAREVRGLHVALVVFTLFASWLMTHISFCFRYAHEYYSRSAGSDEVDRGLEFPGEANPDYLDFAYFSLVLGMTFQVSDVQITARKFRRLAAVQGLLSFLFNTVIVALTVNIAASLL
jgi:uncharacterized membrane protein